MARRASRATRLRVAARGSGVAAGSTPPVQAFAQPGVRPVRGDGPARRAGHLAPRRRRRQGQVPPNVGTGLCTPAPTLQTPWPLTRIRPRPPPPPPPLHRAVALSPAWADACAEAPCPPRPAQMIPAAPPPAGTVPPRAPSVPVPPFATPPPPPPPPPFAVSRALDRMETSRPSSSTAPPLPPPPP